MSRCNGWGCAGGRPARRNPLGDPLKGQLPEAASSRMTIQPPMVSLISHTQHLAVEQRESAWVGAVYHRFIDTAPASPACKPAGAPGAALADVPGNVGARSRTDRRAGGAAAAVR